MVPQVALILRSVQRGYIPDKSFVIVSFLATGVLLIGWRTALAAATQVGIQDTCCLCAIALQPMQMIGGLLAAAECLV